MIAAILLAAALNVGTCPDVPTLCKISPLFCPSAYPRGLAPGDGQPCWPSRPQRLQKPRTVPKRPRR